MAECVASAPCALALVGPAVPAAAQLQPLREAGFDELLLCLEQPTPAALASGVALVRPLAASEVGAVLAVLLLCRAPRALVLPTEQLDSAPLEQLAWQAPQADVVLVGRQQLLPGRYGPAARRPLERALVRGEQRAERVLRGLRVACLPSAG